MKALTCDSCGNTGDGSLENDFTTIEIGVGDDGMVYDLVIFDACSERCAKILVDKCKAVAPDIRSLVLKP